MEPIVQQKMVPIADYNGPAGFQPQDRAFNNPMPMPMAGGNILMPGVMPMTGGNFSNAPIGGMPYMGGMQPMGNMGHPAFANPAMVSPYGGFPAPQQTFSSNNQVYPH